MRDDTMYAKGTLAYMMTPQQGIQFFRTVRPLTKANANLEGEFIDEVTKKIVTLNVSKLTFIVDSDVRSPWSTRRSTEHD